MAMKTARSLERDDIGAEAAWPVRHDPRLYVGRNFSAQAPQRKTRGQRVEETGHRAAMWSSVAALLFVVVGLLNGWLR